MSTAIFLSSCGIELGEDHTVLPDGWANLIVEGKNGDQKVASLSAGDWEQLRDRIDQMLNQR